MWKYALNKISVQCNSCRYGCIISYLTILRDRGYTRISCRYPIGKPYLPEFITGIFEEDMAYIIVMKYDIIDEHVSLDKITPDMILRIESIPVTDGRGSQIVFVY